MDVKTISDLGPEASARYALDQETLDRSVLTDSSRVSAQVSIDVSTPIFTGELNSLVDSQRVSSWAVFNPPPEYTIRKGSLFSSSTIPSLGSEDYLETQADRVRKQQERGQKESGESTFILSLFETIGQLDKEIDYVRGKRSQFQKG